MDVQAATAVGRRWGRLGLGAVLTLSAFVNGWGLWTLGYGNAYYAAAVQSMLSSWHNFFYASFDSGGFVSIDKPPLGFWLQAASAKVLGFSGVALMLPEAAAGVGAVALLYVLVSRVWGRTAGLTAALLLALSPIAVVASRSNIVDGELVFVLLLAAFAVVRAARTGQLRWLLLGAVLVGLGFNVKMLEAYLVVPALALVYLVAAPVRWWRRLAHLAAAGVVLTAVSLCWVVAVDHTPSSQRPYVGSSTGDSELNLVIGYNGWNRVSGSPYAGRFRPRTTAGTTAGSTAPVQRPPAQSRAALNGFSSRETGAAGPLRLLRQPLASQTGWLIPLALFGLGAAAVRQRWGRPFDARQRSLVLFGGWLLTEGAFFSVASTVHAYYTTEMAPAIAALAGIGLVVMGREAVRSVRGRWLLAAALLASAGEAAWTLTSFPGWSRWLTPLVLASAAVCALAVFAWRSRRLQGTRWPAAVALATGAVAVLAAPATWTAYSVSAHGFVALPSAGPPAGQQLGFSGRRIQGGRGGGAPFGGVDPALLGYLESNSGSSRYLVATLAAMSVAPYMIASDRPAMALGGFMGGDRIVDAGQLAEMVSQDVVRFFLLPSPGGGARQRSGGREFGGGGFLGGLGGGVNQDLVSWVTTHCDRVPRSDWSPATAAPTGGRGGAGQVLYDCSGAGATASDAMTP